MVTNLLLRIAAKGVTFDALETIERNSDSIDKLTSLVSKMNMKMDKCETQYKPKVYQSREREERIDMNTDKTIIDPEVDHMVEIEIHLIEVEDTLTETTDQILEVDHETIIDKMIGKTVTYKIVGETTMEVTRDKNMYVIIIGNKGIEIEVEVGRVAEVITEIIQGNNLNEVEILVEIGIGKYSHDHNLEQNQKIRDSDRSRSESRSRSSSRVSTNKDRVDASSGLSTTFLGKTKMTRETKVKAEERFRISGQGYTLGKMLDNTDCQILLDMGASNSYMSKSFYLRCNILHALPKFASNTQRIQVKNCQYVGVLFVILVIVDIHGHRFKIFTLVSEIHENVDLVLGIKNILELEGVRDSHDSCFSFLNRSIPFFQKKR